MDASFRWHDGGGGFGPFPPVRRRAALSFSAEMRKSPGRRRRRNRGTRLFKGIEGARGWLAWTVVATHIIVTTPLVYAGALAALIPLAIWAVKVFIIISGFVIAHLLVSARESYGVYIVRRALRIYPAYLVALAAGLLAAPLWPELVAGFPMQPPHPVHQGMLTARTIPDAALQIALHLTLLHGMVPEAWLAGAQHGFLPPAWSLSLEWQYYLIAPLLVAAARRRPVLTAAAVGLLWLAFQLGLFGRFSNPSLIFGAGWYFLAGILSRLHFDRLPRFERFPLALWAAIAPLALVAPELVPALAWLGLLLYLRSDSEWAPLDGRIARWFGARSYAVYILHQPIILLAAWLAWGPLALPTRPAIAATAAMAIASVLVASELVYRWVERPAIRLGKRLSHEPAPGSQGW